MMNFEWILAPFGQNITGSSQKKRGWRRPWHQACSGRVAFIEGGTSDGGEVSAGCVVCGNRVFNGGVVR